MTQVLVDTSVWIDFFNGKYLDKLDRYIEEDLICTNELILTELLPIMVRDGHKEAVSSIESLPIIPLDIDWTRLRLMQLLNVRNGINKVGIADLIIVQQVVEKHLALLSRDRHFGLMKGLFKFDLIV
jgi:predicted nucleic acid-binding protein